MDIYLGVWSFARVSGHYICALKGGLHIDAREKESYLVLSISIDTVDYVQIAVKRFRNVVYEVDQYKTRGDERLDWLKQQYVSARAFL